jgi:5-methyltetrahydropteroyltriglutamate--homocysteine methyltransferase
MLNATKNLVLPTSLIGSLPRPSWYTKRLGSQTFLQAMVDSVFREEYTDAVTVYLAEQETAGLDICTDGDAHYDPDVGGQSWTSYPLFHMAGFERDRPRPAIMKTGGVAFPMGHILHDYLEARVMPQITGPVGRGDLQYAAMWKTAQRLTKKPVKFGTITPELLAAAVDDRYYKDPVERIFALGNAINEELTELADAGCPVIQLEEPQIHMIPARGKVFGKLDMAEMVDVFNNTVKGLRNKTEVWCHTCWGNPSQQRMFKDVQSYAPSLEFLNQVDADVLTFESCSSGHIDLAAIGERITDKHVPAERLILCSDCGMGREGMSRRHARYKMVALVQGTNIVRKELGLPEAECLAADARYSLVVQA